MEFWYFTLFNLIAVVVLALIDMLLGTYSATVEIGLLSAIYSLAVLAPGLAVSVRRLHDTDRSGWWLLIGFVPLIGAVVLLVFLVLDSQPGANRFGPNPKQGQAGSVDLSAGCATHPE